MNIAVTVRLEDQLVFILKRQAPLVVRDGRHQLLLEDMHLLRLQAEIVIGLQRGAGLGIGVLRDHDDERDRARREHARLHRQQVGGIVRNVSRGFGTSTGISILIPE